MSHEDLVTLKAFLMALENLEQPLPKDVQTELSIITKGLPESAYELHDLAERYEPLNQKYLAIVQELPGEGERLKAASTTMLPIASNELDQLLAQLRDQISRLQETNVEDGEISDEELENWQNSPEAQQMEKQWMETFANSQDVLMILADEALEEFRQGHTKVLEF